LLPEEAQIVTIFSGAVAATSTQPEAVRQLLSAWAAPETRDLKAKHGMQPA
jgi:molybdate transport system substrate-binding protein